MDAKLSPAARFDAVETERFEAMLASEPWRLYRDRVEAELRRVVDRCLREDSELELRRAQGAAAALRAVVDLPASILAEMRKPRK